MAMAETKTTDTRPAALKPTSLNTATAVEMIGVNKWYGEFHVLRDINLKVSRGEKLVICGPSGSGNHPSSHGPASETLHRSRHWAPAEKRTFNPHTITGWLEA